MPGKMLGVLRPSVYRFKFGGFELTTFLDGVNHRDGPYPLFNAGGDAAEVEALALANRLPPTRMEHGYVPCLLDTGTELILFDTGNGEARPGLGHLRRLMGEAGYAPEDVDIVVLTHCHPDHIYGLVAGDALAFPNARYVFGRKEFDFWKRGENIPEQRKSNREDFMRICVPLADRATFLDPGGEVVSGIAAVEANGHSAGHMAYHIESEGRRLLLWGDTFNHYVASLQRPGWRVAVDDDKDTAVETRKHILDMVLTEKLFVVGFHMPFPSVGFVEPAGEGGRWVPVTYQFNL